MELAKMRGEYGYGFREQVLCPELGDIITFGDGKDSAYVVVGITGYRLVTSSICGGSTNVVYFDPLEEVGYYTDCYVIGNILGAVSNTKAHEEGRAIAVKYNFIGTTSK